ncbi:MAG TPA: FG-GAP-like repeat-containing protein, partial [Planctomycetota bacterium]|nr:FG-GAP-like repeat-containing protein [Planctomycetota bacterium]
MSIAGRWSVVPRRAAALVAAGLLVAGCGKSSEPQAAAADADLVRARVEAEFVDGKTLTAQQTLAPLVNQPDAAVEDLVRAAVLAVAATDYRGADAWLTRARAAAPDDLSVNFLSGVVAVRLADFPAAVPYFRAVVKGDPSDLAARFWLAEALDSVDQPDEALSLLRQVRAAGRDADRQLYVSSTFRLAMALRGQPEQAPLLAEYDELTKVRKISAPTQPELEQRGWGRLRPPTARGVPDGPPAEPKLPAFTSGAVVDLDGATDVLAADVDADGRTDLVGWGPHGVVVAHQTAPGQFTLQRVSDRATLAAAAGDIDEGDPNVRDDGSSVRGSNPHYHPALELACLQAGAGDAQPALALFSLDAAGNWSRVGPGFAPLPGARAVLFSDFDHDSLLDVLVAGAHGVTLLRNAGALREDGQALQDATPEAASALGPSRALIAEDIDGDNDVDYVVATDRGLALLDNHRGGGFVDATAAWHAPPGVFEAAAVQVVDLDEDGHPDLLLAAADGVHWARGSATGFAAPKPILAEGGARLALADLDLDGHVDLLLARGPEIESRRGPLTGRSSTPAPAGGIHGGGGPGGTPFVLADLDGDLDDDVAVLLDGKATVFDTQLTGAHALSVALAGRKDNTHGVGALVELRADGRYQRQYARGEPLLFGLGELARGDVLRITWPNGVVQHLRDDALAAGQHLTVEQVMRVGGSCPFLYAWNGHEWVFVTDAIGAAPLGLPAAPGVMVPFRSTEDLKVRGDQLVADGGQLRLCLTEELREVTYMDRLALHAIDHPAGVEIQPNERFTFPPFPERHVHTLRDVRPVARALASNGQDV